MKNLIIAIVVAVLMGTAFTVFALTRDDLNQKTDVALVNVEKMDKPNIVEVAQSAGTFNTLVSVVSQAGLAETLSNDGPFTVFAPTDEAFAKVDADTLNMIVSDNELLTQVLTYHVVAGKVMAADVVNLQSATSLQGEMIDIDTANGVMVNQAQVTSTDIMASNGVIHVIDEVILPPTVVNSLSAAPQMNIVETAISAGSFNTLVTAVQTAGLVETLSGDGPFTVFAPTDEAFAKLGDETIQSLLADPDQLAEILTYHVVAGKVMAADVVNLDSATTVQGQNLTINAHDSGVTVNEANVTATDIETSNGVIHVIDTVLVP